MKKILALAFVAICGAAVPATAQITTGTPTAKNIRTGNRAEKGDYGIFLGVSSNMFKGLSDKNLKFNNPLPLVNLKYMVTDRWEARLGLEFSRTTEKVKGDLITDFSYNDDGDPSVEETSEVKYKQVKGNNLFTPGIAYHFSKSNILDVYAGAELPIGWRRDKVVQNEDDDEITTRAGSFQIGLGAFIGLQAYIGDLPLALGVEYGISSMTDIGLTKSVDKNGFKVKNVNDEQLNKITGLGDDAFESLKARRGEIGSQFRITLTYFFK